MKKTISLSLNKEHFQLLIPCSIDTNEEHSELVSKSIILHKDNVSHINLHHSHSVQNNKHKNDYESEISESTIKDINPFLLTRFPFATISIEGKHFLIYDVPMDGSCFFHTLSLGINGDCSHSHLYRRSICNRMFYDYNIWEDMLKVLHCSNMSPQMYWDTMVASNHWVASAEISAATDIMHCNINIWIYGV